MQLSYILTMGLLALGVAALPNQQPSPPSCQGGQTWNAAHNQCECPPNQSWNQSENKCCYPPMPMPQCLSPETPWCTKDQNDYCAYDQNNDYCQNNGQNSVWCCDKDQGWDDCVNHWYPPSKPQCPDIQEWCATDQKCECPIPMIWKDNKCQWPPMPEPTCQDGQQPWCGKSQGQYCQYDENNALCQNDGSCTTWCGAPADILQQLLSIFYHL